MEVEVSPETAEILFRVLTEEKQENFELKRMTERANTAEEELSRMQSMQEYNEQEWLIERRELNRAIRLHAGKFFPKNSPAESLTLSGKVHHLLKVLQELAEHEMVNHRCQGIVLALGAIEEVDFAVTEKMPGRKKLFVSIGKIAKVQDGFLFVGKGKKARRIPITSIEKVEIAGKEDKKK